MTILMCVMSGAFGFAVGMLAAGLLLEVSERREDEREARRRANRGADHGQ